MAEDVSAWRPSGAVYIWRYSALGRSRRGWHFTADPAGCASIVDLIERMTVSNTTCYRTMALGTISADIWGVPNFGPPKAEHFDKLRIDYSPGATDLTLTENGDRLDLGFGPTRAASLKAAFLDVGIGGGDFGIATSSDKRAESWMFWWMRGINYKDRKRL
jgi:hypothetical protein